MLMRIPPILLSLVVSSILMLPARADELSFNRDIRPILSDTCFFCHGPDPEHREAGLRLDVEEDAKDYVIEPGDVDASELIARITSTDPDEVMPPPESGKTLGPEQIALLEKWVAQGAPYEAYWAYAEPQVDELPVVEEPSWPLDPIDHYTWSAMKANGLSPAADAEPATLIRRLCFDLTGLPPSPRLVESYVNEPTEERYVQIVNQLLASPAFGERMAVYWLDLVRYADTVGYHGDQDHNVSPYRDYVIDAFNRDMPLDQFTREQLAGDLLPGSTTDQLIASAYNRLLQTSHEGGVQPKEYLAIYAADRVRNVSAVWMGATVGCAQCHDHKYDPYTSKDFYSMAAFFADLDEAQHFKSGTNSLPTRREPEIQVLSRWQRELLAETEAKIDQLRQRIADGADSSDELQQELNGLSAQRDWLVDAKRKVMISKSIEPREMRILPRGDWLDDSGPVVGPAVPEFMRPLPDREGRASRLDLANWLTDSESGVGGLTARVFANRFWYLMFGRGISASLADFGGQGMPPTHPELLDHLALQFLEDGWSVKKSIRRLVLTRTYRQSSIASPETLQRDPQNRWFARQSRYRLPAEMVRDNVLDASGLLVRQIGGESVKPFQPPGYYRHLNFPTRVYVPDNDQDQWRRGVYVHWQRQFLHPMLKSMDAPSREECTAQRPRSNTPLEALVLLNDPTMFEAAVAMASRLIRDDGMTSDADRLVRAFQLATSRRPDQSELQALTRLLDQEREHYRQSPAEAERLLESVDAVGELEHVDNAASNRRVVRLVTQIS